MGEKRPTFPDKGYCEGKGHALTKESNVQCAWTEGWASFVPHVVHGKPQLYSSTHIHKEMEQGFEAQGGDFNNAKSSDPWWWWFHDLSLKNGSILEGAVAATLWDMVDDNDHTKDHVRGDNLDGISIDITKIVNVMSGMSTLNVIDFYEAWQATYKTDISNVMLLHNIITEDMVVMEARTMEATGSITPIYIEGVPEGITANVTGLELGTHTVLWTFTNGTKSVSAIQNVTIQDTTPVSATQLITIQDTTPANLTTKDVSASGNVASIMQDTQNMTAGMTQWFFPSPGIPSFYIQMHRDETGFDDTHVVFAIDLVDDDVTLTHDAPVYFPLGTTIVNWKATDDSGNVATSTQRVTILDSSIDNTPPVIDAPDIIIEATGPQTPVDISWITVSDNDPDPIISYKPSSLTLGNHTITWTVIDHNYNKATATQNVTILDTTPPDVTAPPDITRSTNVTPSPVDIGWATATDLVDGNVTTTHDAPVLFPAGTTTVTWTATDMSGNVGTDTQNVTVVLVSDTTPPVITAPHLTIEAAGPTTPVDPSWITVSGDDPSPTISYVPESVPLGNSTISWTVTDHNNNTATATQTVTILDTTPPDVTAPPDITRSTNVTPSPVDIGWATATDLVDGNVTTTHDAPVLFPAGTTTVTWTATDMSGNAGTDIQNVTVTHNLNVTLPTIHPPPDITREATGKHTTVNIGTATVSDTSYTITNNAPSSFPVGRTIVTWTATGPGGVVAATQHITIRDTTAPSISAPPDITREATGNTTSVTFGVPVVNDLVDDNPRIQYSLLYSTSDNIEDSANVTGYVQHDVTATWFADMEIGVYYMVWTATDYMGNSASDTQLIIVQDTTPPTLSIPPDMVVTSTGTTTRVILEGGTATDLVDPAPTIGMTIKSGVSDGVTAQFFVVDLEVGTHLATWHAEDFSGNRASAIQNITVVESVDDTTPPTITAPSDITREATGPRTSVNLGTATATDDTDTSPDITNDAPSAFPLGTTTVTWTATDDSGNVGTDTQAVTIRDTTPPSITAPSDITREATGHTTYVDYGMPTATDLVDSSLSFLYTTYKASSTEGLSDDEILALISSQEITSDNATAQIPGKSLKVGTYWVLWKATDDSGNYATDIQDIIVQDTTPPSITAPSDITREATGYTTYINFGTATATDIADISPTISYFMSSSSTEDMSIEDIQDSDALEGTPGQPVNSTEAIGQAGYPFYVGTYTITWKATDDSGNYATDIQDIIVQDTTPPTLTIPSDITREATGYTTHVNYGTATATDIADISPTITHSIYKWSSDTEISVEGLSDDEILSYISTMEEIPQAIGQGSAHFEVAKYWIWWKATDDSGNIDHDIQVVTIRDTRPPSISIPSSIMKEATGYRTYINFGTATATDIADPSPTISYSMSFSSTEGISIDSSDIQDMLDALKGTPAQPVNSTEAIGQAGYNFRVGIYTITWKATDDSGNVDTDTQYVWVRDTTPPAISPKSDIHRDTSFYYGVVVTYTKPSATDKVDSSVSVSCSPASGSTFYVGTTTVTCRATDDSGNTASTTFRVVVTNVYGMTNSTTTNSTNTTGEPTYSYQRHILWAGHVGVTGWRL